MAWNDLNDMPWLTEHPSVGESLALGAQAGASIGRNLSEARRLNEERRQFDQTMPLRMQQAQSQQQLQQLAIANEMLDNQLKVDAMSDRVTMTATQAAWGKGDTSVVPAFKTPEAYTAWETWKSGTELGKKLAMDKVQFTDSLNNLDAQGRQSVLSLMGNSPMPNSAAWAKLSEEEKRVKAEKPLPTGGPSEVTKLYNDLNAARKAGNAELAKALEQEIVSKGGKDLGQDETKRLGSLEQAAKDLSRIENIFSEIDSTFTGPVAGRIRGAVSGYDEKAALLEQAINAATPNLARGVFREVGVLTDEDIKRYKTQFPTLKDTPEIRAAKIKQLRDRLNEGRVGAVDELKKAGRNVSGFEAGKTEASTAKQFQSEDAARQSGAKSGDIIEIYDPATARYRKARLK